MIIQEPIKATISFALENFAYPDAIFLSERLHAEVGNDESLYMLADSYYRSGKPNVAYSLLTEKHTKICKSAQCLFLLAKCCYDLKKYGEALNTLTGPFSAYNSTTGATIGGSLNAANANNENGTVIDTPKQISADEMIKFFGDLSSFVAQLLGAVYLKLDSAKQAAHYYTLSLKINPFLWSSYEKLLQIDPGAVEPAKLFVSSSSSINVSSTNHSSGQATFAGGPLRRSSRLYSNSNNAANCIKENNTSSAPLVAKNPTHTVGVAGVHNNNNQKIISRTPTKRSRRKISFEKSSASGGIDNQKDSQNENQMGSGVVVGVTTRTTNENLKVVTSIDLQSSKAPMKASSQAAQRNIASSAAAFGLLELMVKFGQASKLLAEFKCKEAIEEFSRLPPKHASSGYALSAIGRAYFEIAKYDEAITTFKKARLAEPHRLQGMEIYSTVLWHQQKEVELSCLAQTLIDFDKSAPETWCVAGNCFSLQKEHEISIKFLKRAIQVDPSFAYAYTLLGHELVAADELDNAMACFRNATRLDSRHYNGWYGIGMIYYKQEKFPNAYSNYKRALEISPSNPILMCHLGLVCHQMKKHAGYAKRALELFDRATKLDPSNSLVRFHRASVNFTLENYTVAMEELEDLKQVVPRESMVYFLIGKIHKIRGETHLALMNFSWAMDLDPKGASNQIKELIDRHYGNDDEIMIHSSTLQEGGSSQGPSGSGLPGSNSSSNVGNNSLGLLGPNLTPLQERSTLSPSEHSSSSSSPSTATPSGELGSGGVGSSSLLSNTSDSLADSSLM